LPAGRQQTAHACSLLWWAAQGVLVVVVLWLWWLPLLLLIGMLSARAPIDAPGGDAGARA
jgi:hypothetical protein